MNGRFCEFRPEPGSRVVFTPAHTQGAGVPFAVRPSKARLNATQRIKNPQSFGGGI